MTIKPSRGKIGIIGAGPAGLTTAYLLTKRGYEVHVFEASDKVGGLSKTIELWGQKVDLGPHRFFSNDEKILNLWLEIVGNDYRMVNRLTRVYYSGKFFYYPLKPLETFLKLGLWDGTKAIFSHLKEKVYPTKEDGSFERWVVRRFGLKLYKLFFKTYSEKLWGISGTQLDKDFAAQRIKKLTFFAAIWDGLIKRQNNNHGTLLDKFAYPKEGTGMVYQRMSDFVSSNGGKVFLNTKVTSLQITDTEAMLIGTNADDQIIEYQHVVSSMPLTQLILQLPDVPEKVIQAASALKFRNTILVYLLVNQQHIFPDNWIYVHDPNLRVGRITNFSNWIPEINGESPHTILCMEYWANQGEELWACTDGKLEGLAKKEIIETGLITEDCIATGYVYRLPNCYPVYKMGYKNHLAPIISHLKTISRLTVIGRYGSFKYNNQDHSLLMGILGAENIADGRGHDLWKVNTDYGVYQEKGKNASVLSE